MVLAAEYIPEVDSPVLLVGDAQVPQGGGLASAVEADSPGSAVPSPLRLCRRGIRHMACLEDKLLAAEAGVSSLLEVVASSRAAVVSSPLEVVF